jgi:5-methylcytosine-specific restriction endonuclease McrA
LRDNVVRVLVERGVPTATGSGAFDLSGREVWKIVAADPISLFGCLECDDPLPVRATSDSKGTRFALDAASKASPGTSGSPGLFCGACTEVILERLDQQVRQDRRVREARIWELNKMTYAQYLSTQEWKATKAAALARAKHRCQMCNENNEELHVHHRVYTRRGCERPEDLVVVCRSHHAHFHGVLPDAS